MLKRLIIALPLAFVGALWFYCLALPWPILLGARDPGTTPLMRQRAAEARAEGDDLEIRKDWVPFDSISRRLKRAVIVAEDGSFYDHDGIDWNALREEFRYRGDDDFSWFDGDDRANLRKSLDYYRANRDKVRGRSTITQQVAKNLYFSNDRSPLRKVEEFIVARRLERFLSKDRILEIYLNIAEWGPGVFGAEAAAQHYFSRSAANLSADQAAALAATLPHPLTSNPKHRPGRMQWRKNMILARMGGTGPVQTVPLEDLPDIPDVAPIGDPLATDSVVIPDTIIPVKPDTIVPDTVRLRLPF